MERGVPIRSISRCIAVLQAINRAGPLSLMQISRSTGLAYPTAGRMIKTLMHEGLIECGSDRKTYRPTVLVRTLSEGYREEARKLLPPAGEGRDGGCAQRTDDARERAP